MPQSVSDKRYQRRLQLTLESFNIYYLTQ